MTQGAEKRRRKLMMVTRLPDWASQPTLRVCPLTMSFRIPSLLLTVQLLPTLRAARRVSDLLVLETELRSSGSVTNAITH